MRYDFPEGATGEALDMAITFLRLFMPLIIFNVLNNLFHSFFRGIKAMGNLVFLTLLGSISKLIFSFFLIPKLGMNGVWAGWVLSWICEAIIAILIYRFGGWRKKYGL